LEIAGFRIERTIGRGTSAVVYEATQVELDRRVALKVFDPGSRLGARLNVLSWPEHPNVVRLYAAGISNGTAFIALQLANGPTLERRIAGRKVGRNMMGSLLRDIGAALDAAHRAGQVHGAVTAKNVFVDRDDRALLSDFGLGAPDASMTTDRAAFAELVRQLGGRVPAADTSSSTASEIAATAFPRQRRWAVPAVLGVVAAIAATLAIVLLVDGRRGQKTVPRVLPGAVALGSTLESAGASVDCTGQTPSGSSAACTVAQTMLLGRAVSPERAGVIRRWAVRGAHGQLALEVLRPVRRTFFMVARTPYVDIRSSGVRVLPANLPIRPGDVVGLALTPGAAVGISRGGRRAQTARWFGPLIYEVRPPEQGPGTGFDNELLLRVELVPAARWRIPGSLVADAAAAAPPGRVVGRYVLRRGANPAAFAVVRVGREIAADLVVSGHRLARLPVAAASPEGELRSIEFRRARFGRQILLVRWQNPGSTIAHEYAVNARALTLLS
jgi:protein kinase-like protein